MTHDEWVQKHTRLMGELRALKGKRDELTRHADYIPGPVLHTRDRELERLEYDLLDELRELVQLDETGAVS